jgi:hypothetical protein
LSVRLLSSKCSLEVAFSRARFFRSCSQVV